MVSSLSRYFIIGFVVSCVGKEGKNKNKPRYSTAAPGKEKIKQGIAGVMSWEIKL